MSAAAREAALFWRLRGCIPVRVRFRDKKPIGDGWEQLRPTVEDIKKWAGDFNVGLLLGSASEWLTDIDLDCIEAIQLAPYFLLETWCFGRASKPRSHYLFVCVGAQSHRFADGAGKTMLEVRAETAKGPGHQTVAPPSIHTSGEPIEWDVDMADGTEGPRVVIWADLVPRVANLARATLKMREGMTLDEARAWVASYKPEAVQQTTRQVQTEPDSTAVERARAYVGKMPAAVSGSGGHAATFEAALVLTQGFALDETTAMAILREFNLRCDPQWSEHELAHKIADAANAKQVTRGYLLGEKRCGSTTKKNAKPCASTELLSDGKCKFHSATPEAKKARREWAASEAKKEQP